MPEGLVPGSQRIRRRRTFGVGLGLVAALVVGRPVPAAATLTCGKPSKCTNPAVVAEVRDAVAAACPCDPTVKASVRAKCRSTVIKARVAALGKTGFPTACRTEVKRALANSTCGHTDAVLCRKTSRKGAVSCALGKPAKCADPFDPVIASCADACTCLGASLEKTSVGCDYWATSMDVFAHGDCFVAYVVNTSATAAHVGVRYDGAELPVESFTRIPSGTGAALTLAPYDATTGIPPGKAAVLFLGDAAGAGHPCPVTSAVQGASFAGTGIGKSFEIASDVPVVAYQENPYGGGAVGTTGSSLLLPTSTWDTDYVAVDAFAENATSGGVPNRVGFWPSMNIVAREDDTVVTLVPNATVAGGGGIPAGFVGGSVTIDLMKGQHAQITQTLDLTGSRISANKPIGLMAGHPCMTVPVNQSSFCDHGELMIPPLRALASTYVGVMYRGRAVGEIKTVWRLVGAVDGTVLTYSTQIGAPTTLARGEAMFFQTGTPFVVSSQDAAHPFLLLEYMTGSGAVTGASTAGLGDPDSVVVVPPDQWLTHYAFFTDPLYPETDLVVVRKRDDAGAFHDVVLDCAGTLGGWQPVGDFQFTRVDLTTGNFQNVGSCSTGAREMHSDAPFGLWVWGWGSFATTPITRNVSYAYPAGMRVEPINALDF